MLFGYPYKPPHLYLDICEHSLTISVGVDISSDFTPKLVDLFQRFVGPRISRRIRTDRSLAYSGEHCISPFKRIIISPLLKTTLRVVVVFFTKGLLLPSCHCIKGVFDKPMLPTRNILQKVVFESLNIRCHFFLISSSGGSVFSTVKGSSKTTLIYSSLQIYYSSSRIA